MNSVSLIRSYHATGIWIQQINSIFLIRYGQDMIYTEHHCAILIWCNQDIPSESPSKVLVEMEYDWFVKDTS